VNDGRCSCLNREKAAKYRRHDRVPMHSVRLRRKDLGRKFFRYLPSQLERRRVPSTLVRKVTVLLTGRRVPLPTRPAAD
jgi:hypothetical protein